jgi:hypothetical protein
MNSHHIWCNSAQTDDPVDCKQCIRLRELYPEDKSADELLAEHFPDAIRIPNVQTQISNSDI